MKKLLITGAKGQLGRQMIEQFENKYDLILTDSDNMDITDKSKVHKVIISERPDAIIHTAAYTAVEKAEDFQEVCYQINAVGTQNVALAAEEINANLFYISTDYVFDGNKDNPYTEEDKAKPLSVYGFTKYKGEQFIEDICNKYYILRTAWVFGELPKGHPGTNFVETMIKLGEEKSEINVVNDQIGSPTYTKDLVTVIDKIMGPGKEIPFGVYHFSGESACSWYEFAKEIFRQAKIKVHVNPINSNEYPQKAKRPKYSYLSKNKINLKLDITTRTWNEMLEEYLGNRNI